MQHQYASGRVYGSRSLPTAKESTTTLALLIWAYQRQLAHIMGDLDLRDAERFLFDEEPRGRSADGCARIADIGAVGCQIDGGGWQRPAVHPDAVAVHRLVGGVTWPASALLRQYAKQGGHPHWDVRQHLEPIYFGGRPEVRQLGAEVVRYASGNVKVIPVTYCPVETYPSNDWVDLCRGEYLAWYAALVELTDRLEDTDLKRWQVTGVGAVPRPWAG